METIELFNTILYKELIKYLDMVRADAIKMSKCISASKYNQLFDEYQEHKEEFFNRVNRVCKYYNHIVILSDVAVKNDKFNHKIYYYKIIDFEEVKQRK